MTNFEEKTTEGTQKKEDYLSLLPRKSLGKKGRWQWKIESVSQVRIDEDYSHTGEAQNYMPSTIKREVIGEKPNRFHSAFCIT